jgi:archaellum component FlaC
MGIPGHWSYTWQQKNDPIIKEQIKKDSKDITDTYKVLYELIKRDIVPYMELKQHEIRSKKDIEYYHNQMEKLERDIKTYEQSIVNTRKTLCEYAEKALKLQQPPVLTKFD